MGGGVIEVGQTSPKIEGKAWEIEDATFQFWGETLKVSK